MIDDDRKRLFEEIYEASKKLFPEENDRFSILKKEYEKKFGDTISTEPGGFTDEEWCVIMEECIRTNQTEDELLGIEHGDDWYD